jgi:hypothetical protein
VAALRHYDYAFKYYGAVKSHVLTVRAVSEVRDCNSDSPTLLELHRRAVRAQGNGIGTTFSG